MFLADRTIGRAFGTEESVSKSQFHITLRGPTS